MNAAHNMVFLLQMTLKNMSKYLQTLKDWTSFKVITLGVIRFVWWSASIIPKINHLLHVLITICVGHMYVFYLEIKRHWASIESYCY